jgi:flavin reductase (DIM6/NTAB) family NADH-FMN oxidoreductase RutF
MACEWTMNVSWEPLLIVSLVYHEELTHQIISESNEFGVNLCSEQQAHLSHFAGSISGRECDKLADPVFSGITYPAAKIQAPMIHGCVLNAECVVEQAMEIGEYTAFVGRVVTCRVDPSLRPLLYHLGQYFLLGNSVTKQLSEAVDNTQAAS